MFLNREETNIGTFEFPRTGFWAVHALTIPLIFYLGIKLAKRRED